MAKLTEIHGITKSYATKLGRIGARGPLSLLKRASKSKDRNSFARKIGVPAKKFTQWVTCADFTRIRGIGGGFSSLLANSGIGNMKQLAKANPKTLLRKMKSLNDKKHVVKQLPTQKQVSYWVRRAKSIKKVVNY